MNSADTKTLEESMDALFAHGHDRLADEIGMILLRSETIAAPSETDIAQAELEKLWKHCRKMLPESVRNAGNETELKNDPVVIKAKTWWGLS